MGTLKQKVLECLRDDWKSAREIARELGVGVEEVEAVLRVLEEEGLVFRDGHLYIHRYRRH